VTASGDLILEGHDVGGSAEQAWGDADYEYSRTVKSAEVPDVLLHLTSDRFQSDGEFNDWLKAKGIASTFDSWR
jgi:hypothetical protein